MLGDQPSSYAHQMYRFDALHSASYLGFVEVCSALLTFGADPWTTDKSGKLPVDVVPAGSRFVDSDVDHLVSCAVVSVSRLRLVFPHQCVSATVGCLFWYWNRVTTLLARQALAPWKQVSRLEDSALHLATTEPKRSVLSVIAMMLKLREQFTAKTGASQSASEIALLTARWDLAVRWHLSSTV